MTLENSCLAQLNMILGLSWPITLEYFSGWIGAGLFVVFGAFFLTLGMLSLNGLGKARKWTAIVIRLMVLLVLILLLGGARWQQNHKDVEVIVVSDISPSIEQYTNFTTASFDAGRDKFFDDCAKVPSKKPRDRIGFISFAEESWIDGIPGEQPVRTSKPIHDKRGTGTDIGSAVQLALATFRNDAMRRIVLVSDGNQNIGDLETAIAAASAQHVPIDVFPLNYKVQNEVMMEKIIAPTWKRENVPFTVEVYLRSTNPADVFGRMTVYMDNFPLALNPEDPKNPGRNVTLKPGVNRFPIQIKGLAQAGAHRFRATFEGKSDGVGKSDTLLSNNSGEAFTFVQGKRQILYVDNARDAADQLGPGTALETALRSDGVNLLKIRVDQFPNDLVSMQAYDAIIMANVPLGGGNSGLNQQQDEFLARYVHDMGGGLVMIGGPDAFGAGGWINSKTRDVLPVNMEIPAVRQIPKGALVLIMHSCEMPRGNYWGEQCALAAMKTLASKDEIGVISYGWNGGQAGGVGGAGWDFLLRDKGDGSAVTAAIKKMMLGDMPSFDDAVKLAVEGSGGNQYCLEKSDARQKHIIIISDGDPAGCNAALLKKCKDKKISISTLTVFTHMPGTKSPQMIEMAKETGGKAYGPIEDNPDQLPQIFIKEATVIQRSLISENEAGIPLVIENGDSDLVKGFDVLPKLRGMVLTSRKDGAQNDIKLALVAQNKNSQGKVNLDPVLAHWQSGLGRVVVFTGDATARWAPQWVGSPSYRSFWSQTVNSVARPPMSTDFDVQATQNGNKGKLIVKANNKDSGFLNFMNIAGQVIGPDGKDPVPVRLVQTGPGTYEADFDAPKEGNYIIPMHFSGKSDGKSTGGELMGGLTINGSPEQRDLQSNDSILARIASATGGRMLDPWNVEQAELFSREGLNRSASPLPTWDILIPILLALVLLDVAARRIAWDIASIQKALKAARARFTSFLNPGPVVASGPTLDALKKVRDDVTENKFKAVSKKPPAPPLPSGAAAAKPDRSAKFEGNAVAGDISQVVGGATDKPIPSAPKNPTPKGAATGTTNSLLEAKKRAQAQIREKEQGEQ